MADTRIMLQSKATAGESVTPVAGELLAPGEGDPLAPGDGEPLDPGDGDAAQFIIPQSSSNTPLGSIRAEIQLCWGGLMPTTTPATVSHHTAGR